LEKYIAEVMAIWKTQPTPPEIAVENVKGLRFAAQSGKYDAIFQGLNAARTDGHLE
jgi:uncharacterized oxidoreductase